MSKLGVRFVELNPFNAESIMSHNIYYDNTKTIRDKVNELEAGIISDADVDGGNASG